MWAPGATHGGEDEDVFELFGTPHLHKRLGIRHQVASSRRSRKVVIYVKDQDLDDGTLEVATLGYQLLVCRHACV